MLSYHIKLHCVLGGVLVAALLHVHVSTAVWTVTVS
jgi:hypothetical protein